MSDELEKKLKNIDDEVEALVATAIEEIHACAQNIDEILGTNEHPFMFPINAAITYMRNTIGEDPTEADLLPESRCASEPPIREDFNRAVAEMKRVTDIAHRCVDACLNTVYTKIPDIIAEYPEGLDETE